MTYALQAAAIAFWLAAGAPLLAASSEGDSSRHLEVSCDEGVLAVEARQVGIFDLFDEVGRRCGFDMSYLDLTDRMVSASVSLRPVEEGIRQVITQVGVAGHAVVYSASQNGEAWRPVRLALLGRISETPASSLVQAPDSPRARVAGPRHVPPILLHKADVVEKLLVSSEVPDGIQTEEDFVGDRRAGFWISKIQDDSLLALAGIQRGDVLLDVNGVRVHSRETLSTALRAWGEGASPSLRFEILRDGQFETRYVVTR
jgi:PDZ domain